MLCYNIGTGGIMQKWFFLIVLILSVTNVNQKFTYVDKEINIFKKIEVPKKKVEPVLATYRGLITAYGPDCTGCTGRTASGYKVSGGNIYYHDKKYGKVRIVASDKSLPFGSIIRIKNLSVFNEPVIAIVLDRGGAIGFNKKVYFDLLYKSEKETSSFGMRRATFEVLRRGY